MIQDPAVITQQLTGEYVRLWPYARGYYAPDLLVSVCAQLNASGMAPRVFWEAATRAEQHHVDLAWFLGYMHEVLPLLVQDRTSGALVGLVWFTNFSKKHRANINLWYERKAWGKPAREGTALATRYAFALWDLRQIWGFTPWPEALKHGQALGYKHLTTLPDYACVLGEPHDLYILLKENAHGGT